MGRIYKQAMRVSAYLGEEDTHGEAAVTLIYCLQGMIVMMTTRTEENLKGIAFSERSQNLLREQILHSKVLSAVRRKCEIFHGRDSPIAESTLEALSSLFTYALGSCAYGSFKN